MASCDDDDDDELLPLNHIGDEEEFRSCCGGDEEIWLKESDDTTKVAEEAKCCDGFSAKMFFKGVSISERGDLGCGYSGIGVVLERSGEEFELIQVQKKLEFYVEECVANYLALMEGLEVALQRNLTSVITREEKLESPLLVALRERVLEKTSSLDGFVLKLAPLCDLDQALSLARVAVGIVSFKLDEDDKQTENCSICCEDRRSEMMLTLKCNHEFCSHCLKTYVVGKVESSRVPVKCPQVQCKHNISSTECKLFLTADSFVSFYEANKRDKNTGKIYCPYRDCSFLLDPRECLVGSSLSSQTENSSRVECPECERFVCVYCGVPWHASMSCEEFRTLHVDETYPDGMSLRDDELEQWPWDTYSSIPNVMGAYSEQERSQIALIQRLLAGGGFSDHYTSYESPPPPPSSYVETAMKDVDQLPWLERFVYVISDDYYYEVYNS
ncbi:unnamed protein product [Cochlearia groenlandica]